MGSDFTESGDGAMHDALDKVVLDRVEKFCVDGACGSGRVVNHFFNEL